MATSRAFNLTAELNLRGPTNIGPIVANIRNQLGNIAANVTVNVAPNAATNVAALNTRLTALNTTLATTRNNAQAAATAIGAFAQAVNAINVGNIPQQITAVNTAINTLGNNNRQAARNIRVATTEMEEFGRQAGLAIRRFAAFSVVGAGVMSLSRSLDQGVKTFIEYDKQLVKLQQVTGQTAVGLRTLTKEITNLSTNFGVSSSDLTEVASTLAQAGLSARDTEKALKALALSSLAPSFDSMNETVEGSIALMRQFGIGAGDLEKALSSINEVAAKFAVEASDIVTAIQRTGGVFATASKGVSTGTEALNEFIAVFTSVRATTRESAETIATGLRTIFSRIQRGDTIQALKEYGVNLTDLDGKFVGAYRAVEELSKGLSRIDPRELRFSQITEELGGFRQIGKVIPLIQQFAVAQEALRTAQKGQGSLARDATTAQLSLANQIAKVREQFLALFREIGGSNTFQTMTRGALSLASSMIRIADSMKEVLPVLGIMFAFKGISAATQFGSGFMGAIRGNQRRANGGYVQAYAGGGTVNAMLMPGEAVIAPNVAARIGKNKLDRLNHAEKYASGGGVKFVPGQGNSDSFGPIPLEVGSYVLRKDAVKKLGRGNVAGLAGYSGGGPVSIRDIVKKTESKSRSSNLRNLYDVDNNNVNDTAVFGQIKSVDPEKSIGSYKGYREKAQTIWKQANQLFLDRERKYKGKSPAPETEQKNWADEVSKLIRKSLGDQDTKFIQTLSVSELRGALTKKGTPDGRSLNKIAGGLGEIEFNKKFGNLEKKENKEGIDFISGTNLYEVKVRNKKLTDAEMYAKTLLWEGSNTNHRNQKKENIDLSKYNLWKVEATKLAKGGEVFGGVPGLFSKKIIKAYQEAKQKRLNNEAWDKLSPQISHERIMVNPDEVAKQYDEPFDKTKALATFEQLLSRNSLVKDLSDFARLIGIPKDALTEFLPRSLDFGGPHQNSVGFASFDKTGKGGFGLTHGTDLEQYGYGQFHKEAKFGYEYMLEEKKKKMAKIMKKPDFEYSSEFKETYDEKAQLVEKIAMLNKEKREAIESAEEDINKTRGTRGAISFHQDPFAKLTQQRIKAPREVLFHEMTHQMMKTLSSKTPEVFEDYKKRVSQLFEGDNDDVEKMIDSLPPSLYTSNYTSADMAYGRRYKMTAMLNAMRGDIGPEKPDQLAMTTLSKLHNEAEKTIGAKAFKSINNPINSILSKFYSPQYISGLEDTSKEEFITTLVQKMPVLNTTLSGILQETLSSLFGNAGIQRQNFADGGMVQRRLGILDTDMIRDPANAEKVLAGMAGLKIEDMNKYKTALSKMAARARVAKDLGSYKILAGVAGTGKSSLATARGQEVTTGTLRTTTRFPILSPEDIQRATDIIDITSTASPQKIESYIKYADKALLLSTSTPEEQALARRRRGIRDTTGVGLYGRKAGATKGAPVDSAELEVNMSVLGSKLKVLNAASLRRKKGSQLISVTDTLMDLYFGSFSPMQKGHEARARMAKTEGAGGVPYVMVGPNESIKRQDIGDTHAARTLVLPQNFRTQLARAALGGEGFSVMPKANADFGIPSFFELEPGEGGQRRFIRPAQGSMAHTQGKNVTSSGAMYSAAGFSLKNIEERIGGFSGTDAREAILSGNMAAAEQALSTAVFEIIKRNTIALQNRANIAPRILENYGTSIDAIVGEIDKELKNLPRLTEKNKQKDPTLEARVVELRKKKKRALTGSGITSPHVTMARLARRYPEYYGLETGSQAKPLVNQLDESDKSSWQSEFFSTAVAKSKAVTEKVTSSDVSSKDLSSFIGMKIPREIYDMAPLAWNKDLAKRKMAVPFEDAKVTPELARLLSRANLDPQNLMSQNKLAALTALQQLIFSQMTIGETKTGRVDETAKTAAEMEKYYAINKDSSIRKVAVVGIDPFDEAKVEGPMVFGKTKVAMFIRGLPSKYKTSINKLRKQYDSIVKTTSEEFIDIRGKGDKKKLRTLSEKEKMATGKAGAEGGLLEFLLSTLGARGGTVQSRGIDFPFGLGPAAAYFPGIDAHWPTEAKRTLSSDNIADARQKYETFFSEKTSSDTAKKTKKAKKMAQGGEVPIMAQEGEYVINRASAQQIGYHNLDKLNKYHTGGKVSVRKFASGGTVSGDTQIQQQAINIINASQINNLRLWSGLFSDLSNRFITNTATITRAGDAMVGFNRRVRQLENESYGAQIPLSRLIQAMTRDLNDALASGQVSAERIAEAHEALTNIMDTEATALQQLSGRRQAQVRQVTGNIGQAITQAPFGIGRTVRGINRLGAGVNGQAGYFLGMGVSMLGTQAESIYGKRESSSESASKVARAEQLTGTVGAGLSLAGGIAGIPAIGPAAAGLTLLATGAYAAVDAYYDFSNTFKNASNEFRDNLNAKGINEQSILLEKALEALAKDTKNIKLQKNVQDISKFSLELMNRNNPLTLQTKIDKANPTRFDRGSYNFFAGLFGMEKMSMKMSDKQISDIAKEQVTSDQARQTEALVRKTIEERINKGETLQDILKNNEDRQMFVRGFAATNTEYTEAQIKAKQEGLTPQERAEAYKQVDARLNDVLKKLIEDPSLNASVKSTQMARAFEEAERAGRRLANSMERLSDTVTQSIQATINSLEDVTEKRQSIISSLQGEGKVNRIKSTEANILRNPKAYSEIEFGGALQKALSVTNAVGGDARVSGMISGSALIGRGITDVTQRSVRLAAGNKRSISLQEAQSAAMASGSNMIKGLNISEETKADLLSRLNQSIEAAAAATNKDKTELVAVEAFDDELKKFGDSIGQRGAELAAKILDFRDQVLNNFIDAVNEGTKQLIEANKYRARSIDIGFKAMFDLRQAKGGPGASFAELQAQRNQRIGALTGGLTDPRAISAEIDRLTKQKEIKQAQLEANANDRNKVVQIAQDIGYLDARLKESSEALKELAESGDLASAALDEIKNITELQKQGVEYNKKLLTTGPKELKQQFDAMAQLRYTLSGGVITNTSQSLKASREAGGGLKGYIAGQEVLAQQRAAVQQAFESLKPLVELQLKQMTKAGTNERMYSDEQISQYIKNQEAFMIEMQGRSTGMDMRGVAATITQGGNTQASIAAQKNYAEAIGTQQLANQELAKMADQMFLISTSAQNLIKAFDELAMRLNRGFANDVFVENPRGVAVGRPAAPRGRSRGGIIYASKGMLVNYEPQGTDTVPAMLTPGEFVVNARAAAEHLPLLQAINRADGGVVPPKTRPTKATVKPPQKLTRSEQQTVRAIRAVRPEDRSEDQTARLNALLKRPGGENFPDSNNPRVTAINERNRKMIESEDRLREARGEIKIKDEKTNQYRWFTSDPTRHGFDLMEKGIESTDNISNYDRFAIIAAQQAAERNRIEGERLQKERKAEEDAAAAERTKAEAEYQQREQDRKNRRMQREADEAARDSVKPITQEEMLARVKAEGQAFAQERMKESETRRSEKNYDYEQSKRNYDLAVEENMSARGYTKQGDKWVKTDQNIQLPEDLKSLSQKLAESRAIEKAKADRELELISLANDIKYEQQFGVRARGMITAGAQAAAESRVGQLGGGLSNILLGSLQTVTGGAGELVGGALDQLGDRTVVGSFVKELRKSGKLMRQRGLGNVVTGAYSNIGNIFGVGEKNDTWTDMLFGKVKENGALKIANEYSEQSRKAREEQYKMVGSSKIAQGIMMGADISANAAAEFLTPTVQGKLTALAFAPRLAQASKVARQASKTANTVQIFDDIFPGNAHTITPKPSAKKALENYARATKAAEAKEIEQAITGGLPVSKNKITVPSDAEMANIAWKKDPKNAKIVAAIYGGEKTEKIAKVTKKPFTADTVDPLKLGAEDFKAKVKAQKAIAEGIRQDLISRGLNEQAAKKLTYDEIRDMQKAYKKISSEKGPMDAKRWITDQVKDRNSLLKTAGSTVEATPTLAPVKTAKNPKTTDIRQMLPEDISDEMFQKLKKAGYTGNVHFAHVKQNKHGLTGWKTRLMPNPDDTDSAVRIKQWLDTRGKELGLAQYKYTDDAFTIYQTTGSRKAAIEFAKASEKELAGNLDFKLFGPGDTFIDGTKISGRFDARDLSLESSRSLNKAQRAAEGKSNTLRKFVAASLKEGRKNPGLRAKSGLDPLYPAGVSHGGNGGTWGVHDTTYVEWLKTQLYKTKDKASPFAKQLSYEINRATGVADEFYRRTMPNFYQRGGIVGSGNAVHLASGGIVAPARYSGGGHVRASAAMINNGVSSNRSVNINEQLEPIYKALGGLLENHASAFGGQIGNLNNVADRFQQAFGMVTGGIAVNHNLTAQHNHSGHLNTLQQNIEDKTTGLVSDVINTMRRSSDGGLDQMLGMDSNQIIGKSKYT